MFVHDTPVQAQLADALVLVRKIRSLALPSPRSLSAAWPRRMNTTEFGELQR
jgi:hypothetical protein